MARIGGRGRGFGGRGRGFGGRGRFGRGGRRRFGFGSRRRRGRGRDMINEFEMKMDAICNNILPPLLYNGMLTIAGRDTSVITHLDSFNLDATENYQPQNATMSNHLMQLQ